MQTPVIQKSSWTKFPDGLKKTKKRFSLVVQSGGCCCCAFLLTNENYVFAVCLVGGKGKGLFDGEGK